MVSRTNKRVKDRGTKTNRNGWRRKMEGWKNAKQMKNKRSNKVFSMMKGVYSRKWYIEERKRLRKYKRSSGRI